MKKLSILISASLSLAMIGCGDKQEDVKNFAIDLGNKVSKNQIDSVRMLYPALDADSLALTFNADSIKITEGTDPGTFVIDYGNSTTVSISKSEDGTIQATGSSGLYAFKPEDISFAKSAGMLDASLDDKQKKARIAEVPKVKQHARKAYEAANKKELTVTSSVTGPAAGYSAIRTLHIKVHNKGNVDVKGSDYNVGYGYGWMEMGRPMSRNSSLKGKDVPAGGTVTINTSIMGMGGATGIKWINKGSADDFDKNYKPTGKEYQEYLKSRKDTVKAK